MANTGTAIRIAGTDEYIVVNDTTIGRFGDDENPGPFTLEAWIMVTGHSGGSDSARMGIASRRSSGASSTTAGGWFWDIQSSRMQFGGNFGGDGWRHGDTPGGTHPTINYPTDSKWHHVAVCRIGDTNQGRHLYALFLDGTLKNAYSKSSGGGHFLRGASGDKLCIGNNAHNNEADADFDGYIDEFRISHIARYGNIEIPSDALKSWQTAGRGQNTLLPHHVKLLVQANSSTTTSTTIADQTGNHIATLYGDPDHVTVASSPGALENTLSWANTAIYFDGNDNINFPASSDFEIWDDDFSIECWFKDNSTGNGDMELVSYWASGTNYWNLMSRRSGADHLRFGSIHGGTATYTVEHAVGSDNDNERDGHWHHIAVGGLRGENKTFLWLDGQLLQCGGWATAHTYSGSLLYIGCRSTSAGDWVTGWMDGIRICKGQSAYTGHFNPYGSQKNVSVQRGGAVEHARHASANTHAIRMGQAAIGSTAATNANTYCIDLDGTNDYLIRHCPPSFNSDTSGSFFGWVYLDATPDNNDTVLYAGQYSSAVHYWRIEINANGKLGVEQRANDTVTAVEGPVVSTGGWHSIGVTSDGTSYVFHYDGTASTGTATSGTDNGDWVGDSSGVNFTNIGAYNATSGTEIGGYLNGKLMQLAMWGGTGGAFSNTIMSALHSAGKSADLQVASGTYTSTQIATQRVYWRMGNHYLDTPQTIYDASEGGAVIQSVNTPLAKTWTTGTTFLEGWQDRGYFSGDQYTTLLLQGAYANGSTTFTDSGPGYKRMLFDGTDDVAIVSSLGSYRSSDTQGTLNVWVKPKAGGATQTMLWVGDSASSAYYLNFRISSSNKIQLAIQWDGSNAIIFESSANINIGASTVDLLFGSWQMFTITYDGAYKLYKNGVEDTGAAISTNYGNDDYWFNDFTSTKANRISLGGGAQSPSTVHFYSGLMSQAGIWGGSSGTTGLLSASDISAIYDLGPGGDWTTSYSTGLVDYWTFGNKITEGTDVAGTIYSQVSGGNDLTTAGTMAAPYSAHTLTAVSGPYQSAARSVFGGSAMYFDGTDDHITIPNSPDFNFGTSDFTVELWVNGTDLSGDMMPLDHGYKLYVEIYSNTNLILKMYTASTERQIVIKHGREENEWWHIAGVRRGEDWIGYVNGVEGNRISCGSGAHDVASGDLHIGRRASGSPARHWAGWIDELRMSTGVARYTQPLERYANTFVAKGDTGDAYTVLQISSQGSKSGTGFSKKNITGAKNPFYHMAGSGGNLVWKDDIADPFGGSNTALYFDGKGYLDFADSDDWDLGSKMTIEAWIYVTGEPSDGWAPIVTSGDFTGSSTAGWSFTTWNTADICRLGFLVNNTWNNANSQEFLYHQWNHCAVTRDGAWYQIFLNGVPQHTFYHATNPVTGTSLFVGRTHYLSEKIFMGYMDNLRISKGIVRYGRIERRTSQLTHSSANSDSGVITSNSTFGTGEATIPYTSDAYTSLLLNGDEVYGSGGTFPAIKSTSLGANTSAVLTITKGDGTGGTAASVPSQRQGTSAFGANSYYLAGPATSGGDYFKFAHDTSFDMSDTTAFTLECWYMCPQNVTVATSANFYRSIINLSPITSGTDNSRAGMIALMFNHTGSENFPVYFRTYDGTNSMQVQIKSDRDEWYLNEHKNEWNHFAAQYDNGVYSLWINGRMIEQVRNTDPIATKASVDSYIGYHRVGGTDYFLEGFLDSVRISKGIARYNMSGTNTKVGLSAIHPSHCKLMITSNTYHGNTHFDDFSDQGNYWNQTPYAYYFDGTDDYIDVGTSAPVSDYPFTYAFWIHPTVLDGGYLGGMFDEGSGTIGYSSRAFADGQASARARNSSEGSATSGVNGIFLNRWHLVVAVFTADANRAIYVDGQDSGTNTSSIDFNTAVDNLVWGAERDSSPGNYFQGKMAQAAMWNISLTQANAQSLWELGPTGNWITSFSSNMLVYHAMGNHNDIAGAPADTASTVYDRSGNGRNGTTAGTMLAPNKGHKMTIYNELKHQTDAKMHGSSAIYFDGNDYMTIQGSNHKGANTFFNPGTRGNFTYEVWMKSDGNQGSGATAPRIVGGHRTDSANWGLHWDGGTNNYIKGYHNQSTAWVVTDANSVKDNIWHHIVLNRKDGIGPNVFIDGRLEGVASTNPNINDERYSSSGIGIGRTDNDAGGTGQGYWKGWMDEMTLYMGTARYDGVAVANNTSITPNYLPDPSGNHFSTSGVNVTDQMLDTPENNFCTLNPLHKTGGTYSEGNLKVISESSSYKQYYGTQGMSSGKWYWECKIIDGGSVAPNTQIGIQGDYSQGFDANGTAQSSAGITGGNVSSFAYRDGDGDKYTAAGAGNGTDYGDKFANNDIIGTIVDLDNGKIYWSKNGVVQSDGDPANGTGFAFDTLLSHSEYYEGMHYFPAIHLKHDGDTGTWHFNFGQGDPDGDNNYTDSEGIGSFRYEPPEGFLALCTASMENKVYANIGPNSPQGPPDNHFDVALYTGNAQHGRHIGSLNFKPDLIWGKYRDSGTNHHFIYDTLRGRRRRLMTNLINGEDDQNSLLSFDEGGYTIGSDGLINASGGDFVGWCWKGGNESKVNNDGTVQTTVSVNKEAGFSIIKWTGSGTLGHGLDRPINFFMPKVIDQNGAWYCWHKDFTSEGAIQLETNAALINRTGIWHGNVNPNSADGKTFAANTAYISAITHPFIAYAWHDVEGFSKFAGYVGNADANGPFVYTGFKPAMVIFKRWDSSTEYWSVIDYKRDPNNPTTRALFPNATDGEQDNAVNNVDFVSNGFKIRTSDARYNASGGNYLYAAWAQMPFKYALAR